MDYIQTSNKVADKFGAGAHGFGPGDTSAGLVATYLSPDWCNGVQQELINVITAAGLTPDGAVLTQLLTALQALFGSNIRYFPAGADLPTADRGPIWSADYNSIMTWQSFTANGAAFAGYASHMVGALLADTQPTPRAGYVASGASTLARAGKYAALRAWAMHHGLKVTASAWAAGRIVIADNADGTTYRVYDVRGEFPRFWDNSRGVVSQAFGAWLDGTHGKHFHITGQMSADSGSSADDGYFIARTGTDGTTYSARGVPGGDYSELAGTVPSTGGAILGTSDPIDSGEPPTPRNTALLAAIKF